MKPILQLWNPLLREKCVTVIDSNDTHTQEIISEMIDTLSQIWWVWLAAPQLGYLQRIILIRPKPTKSRPDLIDQWPIIMINPQIISHGETIIIDREWCLSIPKPETESQIFGKVPRFQSIHITYMDPQWNLIQCDYGDFVARIIQHEIDHLEGKLFLDIVDMKTLCSYEEYTKQLLLEKDI